MQVSAGALHQKTSPRRHFREQTQNTQSHTNDAETVCGRSSVSSLIFWKCHFSQKPFYRFLYFFTKATIVCCSLTSVSYTSKAWADFSPCALKFWHVKLWLQEKFQSMSCKFCPRPAYETRVKSAIIFHSQIACHYVTFTFNRSPRCFTMNIQKSKGFSPGFSSNFERNWNQ